MTLTATAEENAMTVSEFKKRVAEAAERMTVEQLNEVLNRHHGSKAKLARELGVTKTQITNTLNDKGVSARIIAAARVMVVDLLLVEDAWKNQMEQQ